MELLIPELTAVRGEGCGRSEKPQKTTTALPAWLKETCLTSPDVLSGVLSNKVLGRGVPVYSLSVNSLFLPRQGRFAPLLERANHPCLPETVVIAQIIPA